MKHRTRRYKTPIEFTVLGYHPTALVRFWPTNHPPYPYTLKVVAHSINEAWWLAGQCKTADENNGLGITRIISRQPVVVWMWGEHTRNLLEMREPNA